MNEEYVELFLETRQRKRKFKQKNHPSYAGRDRRNLEESSFRCIHCQSYVHTLPQLSSVKNRNHCPYCLWSRHLDLDKAGDRLCACKAPMEPVGLTLKKIRKKYGLENQGELMIIHQCIDCGSLSINRIAADDDTDRVLQIFESSVSLDGSIRDQIEKDGIQPLHSKDEPMIHARLFGSGDWR